MANTPKSSLNREELAEMEIGNTSVSRSMAVTLAAAFLLTIIGVPLTQHIIELRAGVAKSGDWTVPSANEIIKHLRQAGTALLKPANGDFINRLREFNGFLMHGFQRYEETLESKSFIMQNALPYVQAFAAEYLGLGNEEVLLGRGRWLFYQPDVTYLTAPGFLDPTFQRQRARSGDSSMGKAIEADPLRAILEFRDQLKSRGIHLIIMPIPVKPMIEPEYFSSSYSSPLPIPLQNPSYDLFLQSLEQSHIDYLDVSRILAERKRSSGHPQFLRTDTHWTPAAMQHVVNFTAEKLRAFGLTKTGEPLRLHRSRESVHGFGDLVTMLKLPEGSRLFPRETVTIWPVRRADGGAWSPDFRAEVLILGDSFFNIFSLKEMGWGASAGFVEQLSHALQRPLDAIIRNDAGAFATRELLAQDLARGRDRLEGKRIVVWEFALRELTSGNWQFVPLNIPPRLATDFLVLRAGERRRVRATVGHHGTLPRAGTTPYKDYLTAFHLTNIEGEPRDAVVYLQTMKDQQLTPAAHLREGDSVFLVLTSWSDAEFQYGGMNRGELEDDNLLLQEPNLAELAP